VTARDALDQATATPPGERLHRFKASCGSGGGCRREPLTADSGRWTWCPACLTVYDDYGSPVNSIPEFVKVRQGAHTLSVGMPADSLEIVTQTTPDRVNLELRGSLMSMEARDRLRNVIADLINRGQTHVVVDLSDVPSADAIGLAELVQSWVAVRTAGGTLSLVVRPSGQVRAFLETCKLTTVFDIDDSVRYL
jgi:anti-anti-sigma factor